MNSVCDQSFQLRVLFLNPPDASGQVWMKEVGRCGRRAVGAEVWPQTGLAYLAAMVEREGHVARVIDGMAEPVSADELVDACHGWRPDLILVNSATPTIRNDAEVLDRLARATAAVCGFVGPHVSALPRETLQETCADFGIVNEAELTVAELVREMAQLVCCQKAAGDRFSAVRVRQAMGRIRGLVWRHPPMDERGHVARPGEDVAAAGVPLGEVEVNAARPLIADLDDLPFPARHLLPNHAYRMPFFGDHSFATIIPSRGCPWPCTFCRAGRVWGRRIRNRSVGSVMGEIRSLVSDFGIRHVVFMTDSLTLDRQWAGELFDALAALPERVEWICNSRVDSVDAEILGRMKRAGCRMISFGVESGCQEILDACRKRITVEQSVRALALAREAGIPTMAYFVLGLPGETRETVARTIRFARRAAPDYVNFHIATPFPGTELYDQAVRNGWLLSDRWEDFEEEGSVVMQAGDLTAGDLRSAQRRAMRAFYMRPGRLLRELGGIRGWGDLAARLRAGVRLFRTLGVRR